MQGKKKTIIWWAFWIAVIILLLLAHRRYRLGYIQSGSMRPALEIGSVIVVDTKAYEEETPAVGDILVYLSGSREIVHRVQEKEDQFVIAKGDNNQSEDPGPVSYSQIEGRVVLKMNWIAPLVRKIKHLENL